MTLTIAIPTFNRNNILSENIARLLSQLASGCKVVVFDNASDIPVSLTLEPVLANFPDLDITVHRNRVNIGANANILRCIETCQTDWLWILGDDDKVEPDAVARVISNIERHSDSYCVNFSSEIFERKSSFHTVGQVDLVNNMGSFSNMLFCSTNVYRTEPLLSQLRLGYHYTYSMAPHFLSLFMSLGHTAKCYLSNERVVSWEPAPAEQQWSAINLALGLPIFLDLPLEPEVRQKLAKIFSQQFVLKGLINQFLRMLRDGAPASECLYLYDQVRHRLFSLSSPCVKAVLLLARNLIAFPTIGVNLLKLNDLLKKSNPSNTAAQDRALRL